MVPNVKNPQSEKEAWVSSRRELGIQNPNHTSLKTQFESLYIFWTVLSSQSSQYKQLWYPFTHPPTYPPQHKSNFNKIHICLSLVRRFDSRSSNYTYLITFWLYFDFIEGGIFRPALGCCTLSKVVYSDQLLCAVHYTHYILLRYH